MNTFTNCRVVSCGIGFSFGEGTSARLDGCHVTNSGVGYSFHENSNIQINRSSSKNNRVGVDVFRENDRVISDHKISPHTSSQTRPIPVKTSYRGSNWIYYALLYLHAFGYDPYN